MPLAPEVAAAFRAFTLPLDGDAFAELSAAARLEDVGKGRRGAVLTEVDPERGVPIVRTTTRHASPAQVFRPAHARLARLIEEAASLPSRFNHALFERYTDACTTMGAHSDQALDLADGSFIALFSAYQHPAQTPPPRRLQVTSKERDGAVVEVPLTHHGVVVFSTEDNRRFRHRIVLAAPARAPENPWLGVTFRTSKTFVRYRDGRALMADGPPLTLADEAQRREFVQLRRRENREVDFAYPPIAYTLSEGDLAPPEAPRAQPEAAVARTTGALESAPMTFEEAIAAPGRTFQAWGDEVRDGKRAAMIYRLGEGGAEQLAGRLVPEDERGAVMADLSARGLAEAGYDFFSGFVWVETGEGVEVYHRKGRVLEATGDRATVRDGRVVPRSEIATVIAFADDDYIYRGVKAVLRSGQEIPLVTEASLGASGDPTYSRNELLFETAWTGILGRAIADWAGAPFVDLV